MSHIAIDARIINSSTGRYVERLISHLEKIDHENQYSILVPKKDEFFWTPTNPNFTVRVADFANYSLAEQIYFKKYLDALEPDLVHFCMPQQPVLYDGLTVTTVHDLTLLNTYNSDKNWLLFHIKQQVGKFVFRSIAKSSEHIITPSFYTRDAFMKFAGISPDKITVTYEAADPASDDIEPYTVPSAQFISYIGQQSDYKNIKRLGDAHQKLLETQPDLWLVLVGSKNKSAQQNEAYFKSKNYKQILFTGFIPDAQKNWLLKHSKAYVFASLMEGFGLPGLEAMRYGAPLVSSNATCLPEIYSDAALYFDPKNTDDMAEKIESVLTDSHLREQLIDRGYKRAAQFSWHKMAEQTHQIYEQALKN